MKFKSCYGCKRGYHDAGGWVWCQLSRKIIKRIKYYKGDKCGGCKYYKREI